MLPAGHYLDLIDPCWKAGGEMAEAGERHDEYEDILHLLLDGAAAKAPEVADLAACVDHLLGQPAGID